MSENILLFQTDTTPSNNIGSMMFWTNMLDLEYENDYDVYEYRAPK